MCFLKLGTMPLLRKLQPPCQWQPRSVTCSYNKELMLSINVDPSPFWKLQMWNRKRVKTGSWTGSVWCLELVYFWRSRGRARAVSFLVFYSFLYKLEFDSEPLVTFTPNAIVSLAIDLWQLASADSPGPPVTKYIYSILYLSVALRCLCFTCGYV